MLRSSDFVPLLPRRSNALSLYISRCLKKYSMHLMMIPLSLWWFKSPIIVFTLSGGNIKKPINYAIIQILDILLKYYIEFSDLSKPLFRHLKLLELYVLMNLLAWL